MAEFRLPRRLLYSKLLNSYRSIDQPKKRFVDQLKSVLQKCNINSTGLEKIEKDRSTWKKICKAGLTSFMLEWTNASYRRRLIRHAEISRELKPTGPQCLHCDSSQYPLSILPRYMNFCESLRASPCTTKGVAGRNTSFWYCLRSGNGSKKCYFCSPQISNSQK
ncbi:hypothetical protein HELRODRAFT_169145 [Helobdella robusta]|uniref:Uncharacterized protein n=1 Tax=Helobdella robusta TaxID=6412 RepID=T1F1G8_HELRO|nr:hypothetical protein HELRODRAFT_169145 [Helobdella robusta]ESO08335.1 hypothetical protein HELRODRAFT_169145 [Helobdella robusta]